jgi:signal transduction histidine kinase
MERWLTRSDLESDPLGALLRQMPDIVFGWQTLPGEAERISFLGTAANYVGSTPSGGGPAGLPLHPDDLPRWQEAKARLDRDPQACSFEGRYLTLTGATRRFECLALARQPDGLRQGVVLDATQRKAAELAERQVKEIRAELTALKHMASLGQLSAGIVHEIRNPLNFISNFAALSTDLIEELGEHLSDDNRPQIDEVSQLLSTNLAKIRDHAGRVDTIVRSMLLHAHAGSGVRRPTDLNKVVDEAQTLAFHGARATDMSFQCNCETRLDPAIGMIDIVPEDLTRVVVNLASNAFYATERRRHEGHADYVPAVEVSTRRLDSTVEIRVHDNGIGIPEAVRPRLFTPFFTTKPAGEGTGLGLSLSADIVEEHGGTLRYEPMPGGHTVFVITLPLPRSHADKCRIDAGTMVRSN